jgi:hypothetical protein
VLEAVVTDALGATTPRTGLEGLSSA